MPKDDPSWRFALGARPNLRGLVVRLATASGLEGYGFAAEIPHLGYDLQDVKKALLRFASLLEGGDARERGPLMRRLAELPESRNPALAAVETALYDLSAQAAEVPLHVLLGGAHRASFPVLRILALKEPGKVAANARVLVEAGYRYLKIKLDNEDPDLDAARVAAVRQAVGPAVHLTIDANQSYTAAGAIDLYQLVRPYRIEIFEQPVPAADLAGLRHVTEEVDCLVEADESAGTIEDVFRIAESHAASSVSLKLLKLGGLDNVRTAAGICHAAGIRTRMGAHVGSRLLAAAALHLAAATPAIAEPCELGEFARLRDDPFEGLEVEAGDLHVPQAPGLGVSPVRSAALTAP
jgi:L-alanine-DL-glutamate epimerase-like enolase superfamily enzyme